MNKLKHRAIYQGKAYELTGFAYEGKTGIRFWYVAESGNIHNQSGTVEDVTILRYMDKSDINGKLICEGDELQYWTLYENHSDAIDMFGVEPQNNWQVHEVYPEQKKGIVKFVDGGFCVNDIPIKRLFESISRDVINLYCSGMLELSLKEWVGEFSSNSDKRTLSKRTRDVEIIENPELLTK